MAKGVSDADAAMEQLQAPEIQHEPDAEARLHDPDVNYMGPEMGPFMCGHCFFFDAVDSKCDHPKVNAPVEEEGCCNLYQSLDESKH